MLYTVLQSTIIDSAHSINFIPTTQQFMSTRQRPVPAYMKSVMRGTPSYVHVPIIHTA